MAVCVLEIGDVVLRLGDADGLRLESPCCAVVDGQALLLGEDAWQRARLDPRQTHTRFWAQLDQQALHRPAGPARSHADLAWYHLKAVWEAAGEGCDGLLLAVPPDWGREQIALLLGIAQACELPLVGLVSAPVAAASALAANGGAFYVEAQQQRLRGTRIAAEGGRWTLQDSQQLLPVGTTALYDRFAARIADAFLHESRFDPMHRASSEQLLYDQMPQWLEALRSQPSLTLSLRVGDRSYRAELTRQALIDAVAKDYRQLASACSAALGAGERLLLGDRAACLPGLADYLRDAGLPLQPLPADAVCRGALLHLERIRSDPEAPAYVTSLPQGRGEDRGEGGGEAPPPAEGMAPTHALLGWRAWPLGAQALELTADGARRAAARAACTVRRSAEGVQLTVAEGVTARLNDAAVQGRQRLAAGDRLQLLDDAGGASANASGRTSGGGVWHFIRSLSADGEE